MWVNSHQQISKPASQDSMAYIMKRDTDFTTSKNGSSRSQERRKENPSSFFKNRDEQQVVAVEE